MVDLLLVLLVVFIILKLTKVICWTWTQVLIPLWIILGLLAVGILFGGVLINGVISLLYWPLVYL